MGTSIDSNNDEIGDQGWVQYLYLQAVERVELYSACIGAQEAV